LLIAWPFGLPSLAALFALSPGSSRRPELPPCPNVHIFPHGRFSRARSPLAFVRARLAVLSCLLPSALTLLFLRVAWVLALTCLRCPSPLGPGHCPGLSSPLPDSPASFPLAAPLAPPTGSPPASALPSGPRFGESETRFQSTIIHSGAYVSFMQAPTAGSTIWREHTPQGHAAPRCSAGCALWAVCPLRSFPGRRPFCLFPFCFFSHLLPFPTPPSAPPALARLARSAARRVSYFSVPSPMRFSRSLGGPISTFPYPLSFRERTPSALLLPAPPLGFPLLSLVLAMLPPRGSVSPVSLRR